MASSMTGFGLSSSISTGSEIYIEIKGVNHKFLEISVKPNDLNNEIEEFIRKSVTKNVIRGRVDIRIKLKTSYKTNYSIDSKLLKKLQNSLKDSKLMNDVQFKDIKDIPGIFKSETTQKINNNLIKKAFSEAMKNFVLSRKEEGYKISNVILKKIKQLENATKKIRKLNDKNLNKRLIKFKNKALKLIDSFDEGRLEQEALLLALKFDVSEEIDRIFFHTNSLIKELNKKTCSGKKIDFILQELFRESNTLSVKLDDPNLKNHALDMKLYIEEMREQIQNVE